MPERFRIPDAYRARALGAVMVLLGIGVTQAGVAQEAEPPLMEPPLMEDNFSGWTALSADEMSQSSGGAEVAIGDLGVNFATNNAALLGNSVDGNVVTGQISDLNLNDVGGINSLMFNTGNNVNFQNNMLINIFVK